MEEKEYIDSIWGRTSSVRGVGLKISEFNELFGTLSNINEDFPYFEGVIHCQYTHSESGFVEKCDHCLTSASFKK